MEKAYNEHAKTVYRFLYSKTKDKSFAEELTQETFYRAYKSIDSFDGSSKISTWLCQIAKHIYLQEIAKQSKSIKVELDDTIESNFLGPENSYIAKEGKLALMKVLHNLKEPQRELMYLRIFGELSFKEIGLIMDKSETWARVTYFRGKEKILGEVANNE